MRERLVILVSIVVAACSPKPQSEFVIEDPQELGQSATLKVCGSEQPLQRASKRFDLRTGTPCAKQGSIVVLLKSGSKAECRIDDITDKVPAVFGFRLSGPSCVMSFTKIGPVS